MNWLHTFFNYIALSILRLFAFVPYSWTVQIGYALGSLFGRLPHQRKRVVLTNLRLCFPELKNTQIQNLALEHWRLFGRSVLERSRIWLGSAEQIISMIEIQSEVKLGDCKPRIFVIPHFVGLEGGFMAIWGGCSVIAEIYEIVLKVGDKKGQVATSIYNSLYFSSLCKKGTLYL